MSGRPLIPAEHEQVTKRIFELQWANLTQLFQREESCRAEEKSKIWTEIGAISGEFSAVGKDQSPMSFATNMCVHRRNAFDAGDISLAKAR